MYSRPLTARYMTAAVGAQSAPHSGCHAAFDNLSCYHNFAAHKDPDNLTHFNLGHL
jgi:hypothetical protein